jgi:hypothetical protein
LTSDGEAWTNDAWGKSKVSIRVNVQGGIGEVEIETVARETI